MSEPPPSEQRRRIMRAVRGRDTRPELALRRALREHGEAGYRLHHKSVLGRPDVAFIGLKVAVFVDGAFWHGRPDRWHPELASQFWRTKIEGNIARDVTVTETLTGLGWLVLRFWDDEVMADPAGCASRVADALLARRGQA